jgi:formylmethanofuran dehydrogenase subunit E
MHGTPHPGLEDHLQRAEAFHGHVCGGIVIGVRMALLGLREIGIRDPEGRDRKQLMVFVEIDRCATDAITSVTGCRPGKRTMKILDYGKMAATFLNLESHQAVRIAARNLPAPAPEADPGAALAALKALPDAELFRIQPVAVTPGAGDLPGRPVRSVTCARCGETVLDLRDVTLAGATFCRPCAWGDRYYHSPAPESLA